MPLLGASSPLLLAGVSGLALWLIRFRWLRWTALLPVVVLCAAVPIHSFAVVWDHEALIQRCERNDGRRPINLRPEQITPHYRGVTPLRPDEVLLPASGGRGSWWLRRNGSNWQFDALSKVDGSFWPGCVVGDEIWVNRSPNIALAAGRDPHTGIESLRIVELPKHVMDFGEVVCLPDEGLVLLTEALSGSSIWEVVAKTGAVRRLAHEVGGLGVLAQPGPRGLLIAANGSDLVTYSLEQEKVIEQTPAGVQLFNGLDRCPLDGEVALADVLGRIRFFKPDAEGHYHFAGGTSVRAPRSVVYSPDCQHVVVTSWDDETVWRIDRGTEEVVATYRVGPALRGVTFLGPREFAIADACTMTSIAF
jgi:hypothetical protein